jgi:IS605 OrfB family transposase
MYLKKEQKEGFKILLGAYRYYYNRAIQYINNYNKENDTTFYKVDIKKDDKIIINLVDTKSKFSMYTMRKLIKDNKPDWINIEMNSHLIDKAFSEAATNYLTSIKKYEKYKIPFKLKPKKKKDKFQTISIEKSMISKRKDGIFPGLMFDNKPLLKKIKFSKQLNKEFLDSTITFDTRLNECYLNLTYKIIPEIINTNKVCSLDPGVKCFLTLYSDDKVENLGLNILGKKDKLTKICRETDIIQSKMSNKENSKDARRNLRKALHRKIKYIKNLKNDLHNKCVRHLINNNSTIVVPPFEIKKMASATNSKLLSRNLYNTSFYKFLQKLKYKCSETNTKLIIKPEYYTSKTCSNCGNIKHNLTLKDRVYNCSCCKISIDRDFNGARNIMLRNYFK